jgi:RNA-binding protein
MNGENNMTLNPKMRQHLKARAHHLNPVVLLGQHGLTEAVIKEVDLALTAHELIKVKFATTDREAKQAAFNTLCERLNAERVQVIGNIVVLYRKNEE